MALRSGRLPDRAQSDSQTAVIALQPAVDRNPAQPSLGLAPLWLLVLPTNHGGYGDQDFAVNADAGKQCV